MQKVIPWLQLSVFGCSLAVAAGAPSWISVQAGSLTVAELSLLFLIGSSLKLVQPWLSRIPKIWAIRIPIILAVVDVVILLVLLYDVRTFVIADGVLGTVTSMFWFNRWNSIIEIIKESNDMQKFYNFNIAIGSAGGIIGYGLSAWMSMAFEPITVVCWVSGASFILFGPNIVINKMLA